MYLCALVWSLAYTLISLGIGLVAQKTFHLPKWVIPAVGFNNTTSLPLLLIQSLDDSGILKNIVTGDESTSEALKRAQSYFLVCSIVGNSMTVALGPRLMDGENASDDNHQNMKEEDDDEEDQRGDNDEEQGEQAGDPDEQTSLLPTAVRDVSVQAYNTGYHEGKKHWDHLPLIAQKSLSFVADFLNAPLIGALIGAIIGLVPPLHRAFFNEQEEGGIFKAWLTASLKNIGDLFASLQVVVVGVTLSSSLRKLKRGEHSGHVPLGATCFIVFVRFILWPVISIAVIWLLATKTDVLSDDPILWFTMMLMPTGPPAMMLVAVAEATGAGQEEKMATSKMLAISYAITPLICFGVVGALKATQAAM